MIQIHEDLERLIMKLLNTCDSRTGNRTFIGTVQLEWTHEGAVLRPEEFVWETKDSGDPINTKTLRGPNDGIHEGLHTDDTFGIAGARPSSLFVDENELG